MQRLGDHRVGTPDDLASELLASGEECLLVGDGAIRYREVFDGLNKVEIVGEELAYPSASSLVQLAHAQALREEWVKPWELEPLYLRKPDAEINWATRERRDDRRRRPTTGHPEPAPDVVDHAHAAAAPARRAAHRGPDPGPRPGRSACSWASWPDPTDRCYLVAKVGPQVVGFAGLLFAGPDGPRHHHRRSIRAWHGGHRHPAAARRCAGEADRGGTTALTLEVRVNNPGPRRCTARFGFAPVGVRQQLLRETRSRTPW